MIKVNRTLFYLSVVLGVSMLNGHARADSNIGFKNTPSSQYYSPDRASAPVFYQPNTGRADRAPASSNKAVYHPITVRGKSYFYRNGLYYRRDNNRYIVVNPPIGARVGFLPESAISVSIGPSRYFRVGMTWYLGRDKDVYEVVEKPDIPAEAVESQESTYDQQRVDMVIYPAEGQSAEQQDKDRYECYRWASDQSGYDPTMSNQNLANKDLYQRAMTACLESRNYTVK